VVQTKNAAAQAPGAGGGSIDIRDTRRRWGVLTILCVGVFMLLLGGTSVNVASVSIILMVVSAGLVLFVIGQIRKAKREEQG